MKVISKSDLDVSTLYVVLFNKRNALFLSKIIPLFDKDGQVKRTFCYVCKCI